MLQVPLPTRHARVSDFLVDTVGASFAVLCIFVARQILRITVPRTARSDSEIEFQHRHAKAFDPAALAKLEPNKPTGGLHFGTGARSVGRCVQGLHAPRTPPRGRGCAMHKAHMAMDVRGNSAAAARGRC
jgi:hypothetical protein